MGHKLVLLVASAVVVLGWAAPAGAQTTVAERFTQATAAMATGEHERAAAAFLTLASDAPEHALASDALFTAAKLYEERLMDPARALPLYRRLVQEYPDSRTALAAERRAEDIAKMLEPAPGQPGAEPGMAPGVEAGVEAGERGGQGVGPGGTGMAGAARALAQFTDILHGYTERGESESLARAEKLLLEHPDWPGAARVWVWSASVHQRAGRWTDALSHYQRAVQAATAGDDEVLFTAYRGAGDAELALGRLAAAERYYRLLPARGDTGRALGQAGALQALEQARRRQRWYDVARLAITLVVLGLLLSLRRAAGSATVAWQIVRRPPVEVIFMAPIAAVLIAASLTAHHAIFPAVSIICLGGMAIAWLSGAAAAASAALTAAGARRVRLRALLHALAVLIAVIALCYIAIHRNRLIDLILDTVKFGPEL